MTEPRRYDTATARQEFDYFTFGWRHCTAAGLRRIRPHIMMIADMLPLNDRRHVTIAEILERIAKGGKAP